MRTFAAYYRISEDNYEKGKAKARGLGLEAQQQIVAALCKESIVKSFVETKSAKDIDHRPILQQALKYCLENDCWLVVAKLDRLSRNVDDCRMIVQKLKKRIVFCDIPSESEADMFLITMYAAFAEREREIISIRTSQALQAKIKRDGPWQTGNPDFKNGTAQKKAHKANRAKAATNENNIRAKAVISLKRAEGMSYQAIADYLNSLQFRTSRNKEFSPIQVQRLA